MLYLVTTDLMQKILDLQNKVEIMEQQKKTQAASTTHRPPSYSPNQFIIVHEKVRKQ